MQFIFSLYEASRIVVFPQQEAHRGKGINASRQKILGHLSDKSDHWVFVDYDSNEFPLKYPLASDMLTMNERPVKAILEEGNALLTEHFNWESSIRAEEGQRRSAVKQRKYVNFGNYNILIIGSRFLSDYKHRPEMYGCTAVVHNPY
jgi:hypothetical protein